MVEQHFGPHPAAGVIIGLLGLGPILGARLLGEFGDDPESYGDAKARKAYAGTAPITRSSGAKKVVIARYARNKLLSDFRPTLGVLSIRGSPGANAYYQQIRVRGTGHQAALRQLGTPLDRHPPWLPQNGRPLGRRDRLGPDPRPRRLTLKT